MVDDLISVRLNLSAAKKSTISIRGAFFAIISSQHQNGEHQECRSMIYVTSAVDNLFLSYDTMLNLGLLSQSFANEGRDCVLEKTGPHTDEGC